MLVTAGSPVGCSLVGVVPAATRVAECFPPPVGELLHVGAVEDEHQGAPTRLTPKRGLVGEVTAPRKSRAKKRREGPSVPLALGDTGLGQGFATTDLTLGCGVLLLLGAGEDAHQGVPTRPTPKRGLVDEVTAVRKSRVKKRREGLPVPLAQGNPGSGQGLAVTDLTAAAEEVSRCQRGRWAADAESSDSAVLSRVVGLEELDRNTGRTPAFGLCGYLALHWAASGAHYNPLWADLRLAPNRERLCLFIERLWVHGP